MGLGGGQAGRREASGLYAAALWPGTVPRLAMKPFQPPSAAAGMALRS